MADDGRSGIDELDPMEDIRRSVDESFEPAPPPDGYHDSDAPAYIIKRSYHDSERHDPPAGSGDTD